uniref:Single-stranded DNA binding protein n=1 Tax=Pleurocladia lacustris TaxID=246121 RepID=A0A1I9LVZ4_9PHAE|nr:hypothetical protein [Pleurocladia lacustris]ANS57620.1 hypothetical protein [Pleurocladia lacustris]ANS57764.1 hypothetical protein [Pleurocladia lacustris]
MNHTIFVVRVVDDPVHLIYKEHETIQIKVRFPVLRQKDSKSELILLLWGDYRNDFLKYYKVQDYLIIEGTLTLKGYKNMENEPKVIVKRIYPFLLF